MTGTRRTRETSVRASGTRNGTPKTAVEASRRREESDGAVVLRNAVNAAGGKDPDSKRRPLPERDGDCGDTRNPSTNPGPATGAVSASQERTALPRLRNLRQGASTGHPGARLRPHQGERWGAGIGRGDFRGD